MAEEMGNEGTKHQAGRPSACRGGLGQMRLANLEELAHRVQCGASEPLEERTRSNKHPIYYCVVDGGVCRPLLHV